MKKLTTLLGSMLAVTFLDAAIADDHHHHHLAKDVDAVDAR